MIEHSVIIASVEVAAARLALKKMQCLCRRAAPALPDHRAARESLKAARVKAIHRPIWFQSRTPNRQLGIH
jgi:hypothetical protein